MHWAVIVSIVVAIALFVALISVLSTRRVCKAKLKSKHHDSRLNCLLKSETALYPRDSQLKLLPLLKRSVQVMERHNLAHWAIGGTLLGQMRNGGIIPWDDDVDLGFLDVDKLLSIPWERYGLKCDKHHTLIGLWRITDAEGGPEFIDMFSFTQNDEGAYTIVSPTFSDYIETLFPLKPRPYHHFALPTPNDSMAYLDAKFGRDWQERLVVRYTHDPCHFMTHKTISVTQSPLIRAEVLALTHELTNELVQNEITDK